MSKSPAELTLGHLRKLGYRAAVVEHWNPHAKIRQDLFGIIDVLAVGRNETVAVQSTTKHNVSARVHKIADSDSIGDLREAGWTVLVHGWWQPNGPRTKWHVVEVNVS